MESKALSLLRKFAVNGNWRYNASGPKASEPAALACLALNATGFAREASVLGDWLTQLQTDEGSVGVTESDAKPAWPTSLALLSWLAMERAGNSRFQSQADLALKWIINNKGKRLPRRRQIGHDTTIDAWSWAENTHSWLEPTCFHVLALKAAGQSPHPRTRSGVAMIVDRLHETGGCNYGNTIVLGQPTLPHVQPTGLAMLAIADEPNDDPRIARSLEYLQDALNKETATASLCFALLGLTAHGLRPTDADERLEHALQRDTNYQTISCYKSSLLTLAGLSDLSWLPQITAERQVSTLTS